MLKTAIDWVAEVPMEIRSPLARYTFIIPWKKKYVSLSSSPYKVILFEEPNRHNEIEVIRIVHR